jgi:hypothetical protein
MPLIPVPLPIRLNVLVDAIAPSKSGELAVFLATIVLRRFAVPLLLTPPPIFAVL